MSKKSLRYIFEHLKQVISEENIIETEDFENFLLEQLRVHFSLRGSVNQCTDIEKKLMELIKKGTVMKVLRKFAELYKRKKKVKEEIIA